LILTLACNVPVEVVPTDLIPERGRDRAQTARLVEEAAREQTRVASAQPIDDLLLPELVGSVANEQLQRPVVAQREVVGGLPCDRRPDLDPRPDPLGSAGELAIALV
jgi:hypothetical protein